MEKARQGTGSKRVEKGEEGGRAKRAKTGTKTKKRENEARKG